LETGRRSLLADGELTDNQFHPVPKQIIRKRCSDRTFWSSI
jgi:hypothetical protein